MIRYQATQFEGLVVAVDEVTGETWTVAPATYEWERYQEWLSAGNVLAPVDLPVDELRPRQLAAINARAAQLLAELSAAYPEGEVQSWAQQTREAEALAIDPYAPAPLLTAIATARNVPLLELAARVRTKVTAYAASSGAIIGQRQALEDALMVVDLAAPGADAQLEAIQWPAVALY